MMEKQDWRLTGYEDHLYDNDWVHKHYIIKSQLWDHDHCILCFEKFYNENQIGYCSTNSRLWLCEQCFSDFRIKFRWKSIEKLEDA